MKESAPSSRRRARRDILLYGVCGGLLIALLKLTDCRPAIRQRKHGKDPLEPPF